MIEISKGIGSMATRGGHIQIVASPYLSPEDVAAIKSGYEERDIEYIRCLFTKDIPNKRGIS